MNEKEADRHGGEYLQALGEDVDVGVDIANIFHTKSSVGCTKDLPDC